MQGCSFDHLLAARLLEKAKKVDDGDVLAFARYLFAAARAGHLCVETEPLQPDPASVLEEDLLDEIIRGRDKARGLDGIVWRGSRAYLPVFDRLEESLARHIDALIREEKGPHRGPVASGLNAEQKNALHRVCTESVSVLAGGPGTGKSYTIGAILNCFRGSRILVAAPTGKAVAQLQERMGLLEGVVFSTLHRALGEGRSYTIPLDYDLIIVDECSMCDAKLLETLFGARLESSRLVLVGDPDQLPPIESGHIFAEIVTLFEAYVPHRCTRLVESLRTENREMRALAAAVKSGQMPKEGFFIEGAIDEVAWEYARTGRVVLCPLRRGPHGVDALNARIASRFLKEKGPSFVPVLLKRAVKEHGLVNGEIGEGFLNENGLETCYFRGIEFAAASIEVELACCLSVHTAQGSEFDEVLLLMPRGSEAFGREVLYTAATRARKKIELWGDKETYVTALAKESIRTSGLRNRLLQLLGGEQIGQTGRDRDTLERQRARTKGLRAPG